MRRARDSGKQEEDSDREEEGGVQGRGGEQAEENPRRRTEEASQAERLLPPPVHHEHLDLIRIMGNQAERRSVLRHHSRAPLGPSVPLEQHQLSPPPPISSSPSPTSESEFAYIGPFGKKLKILRQSRGQEGMSERGESSGSERGGSEAGEVPVGSEVSLLVRSISEPAETEQTERRSAISQPVSVLSYGSPTASLVRTRQASPASFRPSESPLIQEPLNLSTSSQSMIHQRFPPFTPLLPLSQHVEHQPLNLANRPSAGRQSYPPAQSPQGRRRAFPGGPTATYTPTAARTGARSLPSSRAASEGLPRTPTPPVLHSWRQRHLGSNSPLPTTTDERYAHHSLPSSPVSTPRFGLTSPRSINVVRPTSTYVLPTYPEVTPEVGASRSSRSRASSTTSDEGSPKKKRSGRKNKDPQPHPPPPFGFRPYSRSPSQGMGRASTSSPQGEGPPYRVARVGRPPNSRYLIDSAAYPHPVERAQAGSGSRRAGSRERSGRGRASISRDSTIPRGVGLSPDSEIPLPVLHLTSYPGVNVAHYEDSQGQGPFGGMNHEPTIGLAMVSQVIPQAIGVTPSRCGSSTGGGGGGSGNGGEGGGNDGGSPGSNGKKKYQCPDCNKEFSQLRNFRYHRSRHEGTKQFACTCPVCGKSFNDKGYLSSHLKIHRNAKEYKCEWCEKSFNQRVAYNMHIRIHTGLKPHQCHMCSKAFSRKMLLRQHLRTHTGERPYHCTICGKSFADRSNMLLHQRLHTGDRPYKCDQCNKTFSKNHHLKTHMNHHLGIRPYHCPKCDACFSQSSNMKTHLKKCTGVKSSRNSSPGPSTARRSPIPGPSGLMASPQGSRTVTLTIDEAAFGDISPEFSFPYGTQSGPYVPPGSSPSSSSRSPRKPPSQQRTPSKRRIPPTATVTSADGSPTTTRPFTNTPNHHHRGSPQETTTSSGGSTSHHYYSPPGGRGTPSPSGSRPYYSPPLMPPPQSSEFSQGPSLAPSGPHYSPFRTHHQGSPPSGPFHSLTLQSPSSRGSSPHHPSQSYMRTPPAERFSPPTQLPPGLSSPLFYATYPGRNQRRSQLSELPSGSSGYPGSLQASQSAFFHHIQRQQEQLLHQHPHLYQHSNRPVFLVPSAESLNLGPAAYIPMSPDQQNLARFQQQQQQQQQHRLNQRTPPQHYSGEQQHLDPRHHPHHPQNDDPNQSPNPHRHHPPYSG